MWQARSLDRMSTVRKGAVGLLLTFSWVSIAVANSFTWDGAAGEFDFSDGANWEGGDAPTSDSGTQLVFGTGAAERGSALQPLNQDIATPMDVESLQFVGDVEYFLGGGALRLTPEVFAIDVASPEDSTSVTINNDLIFAGSGQIRGSDLANESYSVVLGGHIEILAGQDLELRPDSNSASITFDGVISGAGSLSGQRFHTATYRFNQENTFSGGVVFGDGFQEGQRAAGTFEMAANNALGTGLIDASHRDGNRGITFVAVDGPVTMDNDFRFSTRSNSNQPHQLLAFSGNDFTLTGDMELDSGNTHNETWLQVATGITVTLNGDISDGGSSSTKRDFQVPTGGGTFVLTSTGHSYEGSTVVGSTGAGNAVTLRVDGNITSSSGVVVHEDATLRGTGTVPTVTVNEGGLLRPGNSVGTLTVDGMVNMEDGSILQIDIVDDEAGRVSILGSSNHMDFLGAVTLDITGTLGSGPYTIVSWEDVATGYGMFDEILLNGDAVAWQQSGWDVDYGDTHITLIPEPSTTLLLLLGSGLLWGIRRACCG